MKIYISMIFFWVISIAAYGQIDEIVPSDPVTEGDTETYSYEGLGFGNDFFWQTDGGVVSLPQLIGNVYRCQVTWETPGNHSLKLYAGNELAPILVSETTITVEVLVILPPPAVPNNPVLGTNPLCGPKRIDRVGTPPSGVQWYWQSSPTGTSTSLGFGASYNANNSGTYFLRARNTSDDESWSTSSSSGVSVTINNIPDIPNEPVVNFFIDELVDQLNCHSRAEIVKPNTPSGVTYYWQGIDADGTSETNDDVVYEIDRSGIYYIRAKSNFSNCWSESRGVEVIFRGAYKPLPPVISSESCGVVVLSKQTEFQNPDILTDVSTFWQGTNEISRNRTGASAQPTYTVTESGRYYLRGYNHIDQCWGTPSFIDIVIDAPGLPPKPDDEMLCGRTVLTRPAQQGDVNYYWQMSANGTDKTSQFSQSNEYVFDDNDADPIFLRGVNEEDCWGEARQMNPVVIDILEVPTPDIGPQCSIFQVAFLDATIAANDDVSYKILDGDGNEVSPSLTFPNGNPGVWDLDEEGTYLLALDRFPDFYCAGDPLSIVVSGLNTRISVDAGAEMAVFLEGNSVALTGMSHDGGWWTGPGIANSSSTAFDPSGLALGDYTITYHYSNDNGCISTDTRRVSILPVPVISAPDNRYIVPGGKLELSVPDNYTSYQWRRNGATINGAIEHTYEAYQPGFYTLRVSLSSSNAITDELEVLDGSEIDDFNFVRTYSVISEGVDKDADLDDLFTLNSAQVATQTQYLDGLGRSMQNILTSNSPDCKDVVQPIAYDGFSRVVREFLPYTSTESNGLFRESALLPYDLYFESEQYLFYQADNDNIVNDATPYGQNVYEYSPLNRMNKTVGPGEDWELELDPNNFEDQSMKYQYLINRSSDNVLYWKINESQEPEAIAITPDGWYSKTIVFDEQNHQVVEFVDNQGRTVLKRVQAHENGADTEEWADTYYIYDDFGQLLYVLAPEASKEIGLPATYPHQPAADLLEKWAFQYKYDYRKRMVEKKVPGADKVYLVYDRRNRLVLTQDGNQRDASSTSGIEWTFTKYDHLNRPIITGTYLNAGDRETVQNLVNAQTVFFHETPNNSQHGYTNQSFPTASIERYLTFTYYDNYDFLSLADFGSAYNYDAGQIEGVTSVPQGNYSFPDSEYPEVKGQVTGGKVRNIATGQWLGSVTYYDDEYRVLQIIAENHLGGIDKASNLYNFSGWVLRTNTIHDFPGKPLSAVARRFVYDHTGRLMEGYHELFVNGIGNGEVLLAQNHYNELGELIEKNLHVDNGTPAQSVDYRYNIRGWLKRINTSSLDMVPEVNEDDAIPDYFGMDIFYNTIVNQDPSSN